MEYRVVKEGDLFFLTDKNGDITENNENGYGLYTKDTRFLSRMEVFLDGEKPSLLSSSADRSYFASIRLMKDKKDEGSIEIHRERFIYDGVLYERMSLTNFFPKTTAFDFSAAFDADFQDMFIVRKYRTGEVGEIVGRDVGERNMSIRYQGADDILRETRILWDQNENQVDADGNVRFSLSLESKATKQICFFIMPVMGEQQSPELLSFEEGLKRLDASYNTWNQETSRVTTNVDVFNGLYRRGVQDLRMLMTDVGYGEMPVAGLPWFAVPFGRDSLITSLFMLPLNPEKVKGTLRTLAAYQGTKVDAWRDEQPGKIMHEIRFGELVNTGQSPFGPYYGSVDATPLFLVLLGEYIRWTGDLSFVQELKSNVERALDWIDRGMEAGAGFLTYHQEAEKGFPNQGWKDSSNSIVHASGEYARSPIALSEVQGYVYQAKKSLAPIFERMGEQELAEKLEKEAEAFRTRFEQTFWMEHEQFYAIALDEDQQKVQSVTSNPGHLLMTGLPDSSRADLTAERLVAEDMFNGYGIRTMSTEATGYYPMSYHNGSVWPHDNGMILLGLSRSGYKKEAGKVISGLLEASRHFEYQRLPELFCGHDSEAGYPVPYPTTCSPQAWAAGTSIVFLQAMLGINPNALTKEIRIDPFLPESFEELVAEHIHIGTGHLSLKVTRGSLDEDSVQVEILENTTGFELIHTSRKIK
ncbi:MULTISPECIES: amylo-alpha-1,6-glucosidase [unclassified Paenibacillus]|uniref:amylo-alpha-1,6-glucosidase n=1 Tax=unclassified Paenibacillus TaxID=185978 RepID=UPI001AEA2394|nr:MULTISPECIES: amylo-alpha-1,6-glucosidase [unclassified Paenibacillus]MBP1154125.1 glycogen debranching enzyme [Paenibacillus sp. PvP091]MBP1170490.1 glycogen debranching enzyme [Paenibacillus sp. PvR098]MBP2441518.1 glycogen debranching enzyme [Paenibacillus sp. PvP052]